MNTIAGVSITQTHKMGPSGDDIQMDNDPKADIAFENQLNGWLEGLIADENFESMDAETDIQNIVEYLGQSKDNDKYADPDYLPAPGPVPDAESCPRPKEDGLNNIYVRVLHTNGIHHIGLVACSCHGPDTIVLYLFACRLLPASFVRIRTIFTTQLMDYF